MKEEQPNLTRNEIISFVSTIAKFVESIRQFREHSHLYYLKKQEQKVRDGSSCYFVRKCDALLCKATKHEATFMYQVEVCMRYQCGRFFVAFWKQVWRSPPIFCDRRRGLVVELYPCGAVRSALLVLDERGAVEICRPSLRCMCGDICDGRIVVWELLARRFGLLTITFVYSDFYCLFACFSFVSCAMPEF